MVVCDGFVGNVVMKLTEGLGAAISGLVGERLGTKFGKDDISLFVSELYEATNVVEVHGGGPLLGVNGVSVVGHGRGNADSVRRAINSARQAVEVGYVSKLNEELAC